MRSITRVVSGLILLFLLLVIPTSAMAMDLSDDQIILGDNYTLKSGEIQNGSVVVFGGNVTIEEDARVNGDVIIFGGNLALSGSVNGSVISIGSNTDLDETSVVTGDLVSFGGTLDRATGAKISGQVITETEFPLLNIPSLRIPKIDIQPKIPSFDFTFDPLRMVMSTLWFLFRVFITAALAVLIVLIFPRPTERSAQAISKQPLLSFVVGLLTAIVLPIILVLLGFTIILIPVSFIGFLILAGLMFFGWVSLGYFLGERLMGLFKVSWAPAVTAGIGTFALSFFSWGFSAIVSCLGWILPWTLAFIGLGAVLITRVGTQSYAGTDIMTASEQSLSSNSS